MGKTSEQLESSVGERLTPQPDPLEEDISQYLLLHHDYAAKPNTEVTSPLHKMRRPMPFSRSMHKREKNTKSKLKQIRPKLSTIREIPSNIAVPRSKIREVSVIEDNEDVSEEVVYGTYDEATNSITIIVNDHDLNLSEAVTEVITIPEHSERQYLTVGTEDFARDASSPVSSGSVRSDLSDCGYESYDSPHSSTETDVDIWDESMSELFPSLI